MYRALLSVSGFTLLSRVTGFVRDIILAAVLGGTGPLAEAFFIAFRLPNHFRAIFAEGAYSAAFIPLYSKLRRSSAEAAHSFSRNMLGWQIIIQIVLLIVALFAMPWIVMVLALGRIDDPYQIAMAIDLTRVTFVYLLCITIVSHLGGMLNAEGKFWAAAAAPILLNIAMAGALLSVAVFPNAGFAAACGVALGGVLEVVLLVIGARAAKLPALPSRPVMTGDVREFFVRFWPATLGAASVQLAILADTFLAGFLPDGSYSALYYADRINQLPMGVVAIALGTVLLPDISRSISGGDTAAAHRSFTRATEIGLLLTLPCTAAFFAFPGPIVEALFVRGNYTESAAATAASVLLAYAIALPAFVVLRTVTPLFHARGDTRTPVVATGIAIAANLAAKLGLIVGLGFGVEGLALGTSLGTWVNVVCLSVIAWQRGHLVLDPRLVSVVPRLVGAGVFATVVTLLVAGPLSDSLAAETFWRAQIYFVLLGLVVLGSYGVALLGFGWKR
jgi:putative peptidoglycan lipid II flippase